MPAYGNSVNFKQLLLRKLHGIERDTKHHKQYCWLIACCAAAAGEDVPAALADEVMDDQPQQDAVSELLTIEDVGVPGQIFNPHQCFVAVMLYEFTGHNSRLFSVVAGFKHERPHSMSVCLVDDYHQYVDK